MFRLYKGVIFRLLLNLRLVTNACHVFYTVPSEISSGLQICLLRSIKISFLTEYNACGRDASVVAWLFYCLFLFIGNCFVFKPLKIAFLSQLFV